MKEMGMLAVEIGIAVLLGLLLLASGAAAIFANRLVRNFPGESHRR